MEFHLTQVIKCPGFVKEIPQVVLARGKKVHASFEQYLKERKPNLILEKQHEFWILDGVKLIFTPDALDLDNGIVYEFKSSEHPLTLGLGMIQVQAYAALLNAMYKTKPFKAVLLRIYPDFRAIKIFERTISFKETKVWVKWLQNRVKAHINNNYYYVYNECEYCERADCPYRKNWDKPPNWEKSLKCRLDLLDVFG